MTHTAVLDYALGEALDHKAGLADAAWIDVPARAADGTPLVYRAVVHSPKLGLLHADSSDKALALAAAMDTLRDAIGGGGR